MQAWVVAYHGQSGMKKLNIADAQQDVGAASSTWTGTRTTSAVATANDSGGPAASGSRTTAVSGTTRSIEGSAPLPRRDQDSGARFSCDVQVAAL